MPLSPNQSIYERCEMIQRDTLAELPVLNGQNSPKLGTLCWVTEGGGQMWAVVADSADPSNLLTWVQVGPSLSGVLPDQRFTVGAATYNLQDPGVDTFTTVQAGIVGAVTGAGTTLGAASATSQRLVEVQPGSYNESIALVPWVHLNGMGLGPNATRLVSAPVIGRAVTYTNAEGYVVVRNMNFDDIDFSIVPTGTLSLRFENCHFSSGCTWVLTLPGTAVNCNVDFVNCTGGFAGFDNNLGANDALTMRVIGNEGLRDGAANSILLIAATPSFTGFASSSLVFTFGSGAAWGSAGGEAATFGNIGNVLIETSDCLIATSGPAVCVWRSTGNVVRWNCWAGTKLDSTPVGYFNTTGAAQIVGGQVEITNHTPVKGSAPLVNPGAGATTATSVPSNRMRCSQRFDFNVPAAGAPILDQTINGVGATDAYADEIRIVATYQPGAVLQPDTGIPGTFQYATFLMIDPSLYEDGREVVYKNHGDPNNANQREFALRLPDGTISRIDYNDATIASTPIIADPPFVILSPGESVRFSVDRTEVTPRYLIST